ncbi:hypothetical protein V8C86DRAFT_2764343 [Haematococcus lacustris]
MTQSVVAHAQRRNSPAGAYGMQQLSTNGVSGMWGLLPKNWELPQGSQPSMGSNQELAALQAEMRKLAGMVGDVARSSNRPTVVHLGNRGNWTVLIYPALAGSAVLFLYCKLSGSSIWDLLYVSRSSLTAFRSTVQEGMSKMWDEMRKQKEEIFKVVSTLGKKQDEMKDSQEQLMVKQEQMDERLRRVDDTCYNLDSKANHTIERVQCLDNRLQDVHAGVTAANQGIFMLVSAVSEVTQKIGLHNSRTTQALKGYIQGGPGWQAAATTPATQGLGPAAPLPQLPASISTPVPAASSHTPSLNASNSFIGGLRGLMGGSVSAPSTDKGPTSSLHSAATAAPDSLHSSNTQRAKDRSQSAAIDRSSTYAGALNIPEPSCTVQELPSTSAFGAPAAAQPMRVLGFS